MRSFRAAPRPIVAVGERVAEPSLEDVYRRFAPAIHRRCRTLLADDDEARDALQDIFVALHSKLATFRGDAELMTWLYRVSTNHCLNRLRAAKVRAKALRAVASPDAQGPSLASEVERRDLLRGLLAAFDADDVALVVHSHVDEMTQPEIARVLGVSERTVRARLKRIEERARAELAALDAIGREGRRVDR
ncbi:sigma-70 family RNA polymerase sigma factor [Myxococcota bacterium]|nr:sigma-70 family RNA polymerase sigma factor [Myxococcota bacterium]